MKKAPKKNTLDLATTLVQDSSKGGLYGNVCRLSGSAVYFRTEGDTISFTTYRGEELGQGPLVEGSTPEIRVARSWYAAQGIA